MVLFAVEYFLKKLPNRVYEMLLEFLIKKFFSCDDKIERNFIPEVSAVQVKKQLYF